MDVENKNVKVQQSTNNVKSGDFDSENLSLFNQAQLAVAAGLAYTSKMYSKIDNPNAPKNSEKGTFAYDNSKSVHYTS